MENETKNLIKYLIAPLLIITLLVGFYARQEQRDWLLHIEFYDVGQGDSYLITTYEGNQVLVDGGPGDSVLEKLAEDMGVYDKTIEMMVLTHAHLDHFEGLIAVLKKYQVKKILLPNVEYKSEPYNEFLRAVENEQAEKIFAVQGQRIYLDKATVLDVLYPSSTDVVKPKQSADINDTSIVAMLRFGNSKILLTGDAGTNIEQELMKRFNLDADLLKVGHHGSKYSTSQEFIEKVTPLISVIQLGKNNYGHPAPDTINRLVKSSSQIYRTDDAKNVEFVSDGTNLQIR
jgi:competence protein ComEC